MLALLIVLCMSCEGHHLRNKVAYPYWIEMYHYPGLYTERPDPQVADDTVVPPLNYTPDFRLEEPYYTVYDAGFFREYNRPYRLSPHSKQTSHFDLNENAHLLGCYCCTVYRRHHVLATCAILTQRHILTTATSTDVVLRNFQGINNMQNILGIWYERNENIFNSSLYHPGPSRIHYHPQFCDYTSWKLTVFHRTIACRQWSDINYTETFERLGHRIDTLDTAEFEYQRDYEGNVSHPLPCLYDLAVWSGYWFFGTLDGTPHAFMCQRAGSTWQVSSHTIPRGGDRIFAVGYLFMKAYGRRPLPYFKYGVRANHFVWPCPKSDWHWFHCVQGEWARLGMDSGGAMHLMDLGKTGRNDGLSGMCAFSLKLRSRDIVHYYTVVDTHPVLDFLYDAYMGYAKYEFLDYRFYNTEGGAPRMLAVHAFNEYYEIGHQPSAYPPPNYRKR